MVYEVNLKLRFLPACGEVANSVPIRQGKHTAVRHKGCKRSACHDYAAQETLKTKTNKTKQK